MAEVPASSLTGKALAYLSKHWSELVIYADTGHLAMDNNVIERHIKKYATGRKNWMFADTPAGASASATLYSVLVTAQMHGHNPHKYLSYVFAKLPYAEKLADFEELLPYKLEKQA